MSNINIQADNPLGTSEEKDFNNELFSKWKYKRFIFLAVGTLIMMCISVCYAWSVFNAPISAEFPDWPQGQLQLTFTIFMMSYAGFGILGGVLVRKLKTVKINLCISAVLLFASFLISSQARGLVALYLGFGLLGGMGVVFAYNAVIVNVTKWFGDMTGISIGVLMVGYGLGSFLMGSIYSTIIKDGVDWRTVFIVIGATIGGIVLLGMLFMSPPPAWYEAPYRRPKINKDPIQAVECTPAQMIKRKSFWLLFGMGTFTTMAGMGIISNARNLLLSVDMTLQLDTIALLVGLISIASAAGRLFTGFINDWLGLRFDLVSSVVGVLAATLLTALAVYLGNIALLIVAFIFIGFFAGDSAPDGAIVAKKFYGEKHYQVNLQIVMACGVIHAFSATLTGGLFDISGGYIVPLLVLAGMALIGAVCGILMKRP